jgi:hypothetical protein
MSIRFLSHYTLLSFFLVVLNLNNRMSTPPLRLLLLLLLFRLLPLSRPPMSTGLQRSLAPTTHGSKVSQSIGRSVGHQVRRSPSLYTHSPHCVHIASLITPLVGMWLLVELNVFSIHCHAPHRRLDSCTSCFELTVAPLLVK